MEPEGQTRQGILVSAVLLVVGWKERRHTLHTFFFVIAFGAIGPHKQVPLARMAVMLQSRIVPVSWIPLGFLQGEEHTGLPPDLSIFSRFAIPHECP